MIKDTFSLEAVPKEALYLGMAGVIPYLATSLETVYLAWEIKTAAATGDGMLFSGQSAELLLHMLEPVQVGYGAVVSFTRTPSTKFLAPPSSLGSYEKQGAKANAKIPIIRSSPSSEPSTGVSSGPATAASTATSATPPVWLPPPSPGLLCSSPSSTP